MNKNKNKKGNDITLGAHLFSEANFIWNFQTDRLTYVSKLKKMPKMNTQLFTITNTHTSLPRTTSVKQADAVILLAIARSEDVLLL